MAIRARLARPLEQVAAGRPAKIRISMNAADLRIRIAAMPTVAQRVLLRQVLVIEAQRAAALGGRSD
eukprot:3719944-Pyramimonas_sp.AAC.1